MGAQHKDFENEFWANVDKSTGPDGCWIWKGYTMPNGYGRTHLGSKTTGKVYAHRLSWELAHGAIPERMCVCHNCPGGDNPRCVNPAHLFLGTVKDNNRDARDKGYSVSPRGEKNGSAKLTVSQVLEIRALAKKGIMQTEIAKLFSIDHTQVSAIVLRKKWKHI